MAITKETRDEVFQKANGKCECSMNICDHIGRCNKPLGYSWEAHHKTSVASGGTNTPSNLIAMC